MFTADDYDDGRKMMIIPYLGELKKARGTIL